MLDHPDFFITAIVFPYTTESSWAVKVTYKHRQTGKLTQGFFVDQADYFRVQQQTMRQLAAREYVSCTHEPKPKRVVAVTEAPVIKGKGKKK